MQKNMSSCGALVLVVGPSGSGKDTLIGLAREQLKADAQYVFPRRVITRIAQIDAEDHDTMDIADFERAEAAGQFALSWGAHGLRYGIRKSCLAGIARGETAIVNVSRAVISMAEAGFDQVTVLSIVCDPALLARRIAGRGRETADEIEARLRREVPLSVSNAKLVEIRNETTMQDALEPFLAAIRESALLSEAGHSQRA
jgi:phosphonate metabolism protein PhnN/1,5-bisphosphokinase (PRPP-forming)